MESKSLAYAGFTLRGKGVYWKSGGISITPELEASAPLRQAPSLLTVSICPGMEFHRIPIAGKNHE